MSHEKAIFDGVRTRLGVRKSREMTLRIHRLENNEYWKDRSSPQTSDTISPIKGPRPRPYEPVLAFRLAPLMAIAVRLGSSPHRRCHRRYWVVSGARITVRGSDRDLRDSFVDEALGGVVARVGQNPIGESRYGKSLACERLDQLAECW